MDHTEDRRRFVELAAFHHTVRSEGRDLPAVIGRLRAVWSAAIRAISAGPASRRRAWSSPHVRCCADSSTGIIRALRARGLPPRPRG